MGQKNKSTQRLINLSLIPISVLVLLLAFEIVLRMVGYNPFQGLLDPRGSALFLQPSSNPARIYSAVPGSEGRGFGTRVSINSHGFRGPEYSMEKPAGVFRIVVIGDSITFGNYLQREDIYPTLFEQRLRADGRQVEVLNLGLAGYDTLQEAATLEDIGLKFSPDLVVLGYCFNDIAVVSGHLNYVKRLQKYGQHAIYRLRLAQFIRIQLDRIEAIKFTKEINKKENFYQRYKDYMADISGDPVLEKLRNEIRIQIEAQDKVYEFTRAYSARNNLRRLRYGFDKLSDLQREHGFDMVALVFPYLLEDESSAQVYKTAYDIIEHEMSRQGFVFISLYPEYEAAGFDQLIRWDGDGIHTNRKGHALAAGALVSWFRQTYPQKLD